jgi:hypothetical protein
MTCNCVPDINKIGAKPANIQWTIVRGDTGTLRVEFLENDETPWDTDTWTYDATAYNPIDGETYALQVTPNSYYVDITALPEDTVDWGVGASSVVAELSFDLEVTIPGVSGLDDVIWTPVIGTICVLGDISGGSL